MVQDSLGNRRDSTPNRRRVLEGIATAGVSASLLAAGTSSALGDLPSDDGGSDLGDGDWLERTVDYTVNGNTKRRVYYAYVPPAYDDGDDVPLVTMLHGCGQDPEGFAVGTEMNELADEENFVAIYPDQTTEANADECWNWFDDNNQHRGQREARLIAKMTRDATSNWDVDTSRVYVCGMSAGGAQAVNQAVTYPDRYAAMATHSGLEYDAADSWDEALVAMEAGGPDPDEAGKRAYDEMETHGVERVVPTYVVHGDADTVVRPVNGEQTAKQWIQTNDIADDGTDDDNVDAAYESETTGTSDGGYHYTIRSYARDSGGEPLVKYFTSTELGHNWSGGDPDGPDTDPLGEPVTPRIWNFFENHPK